MYTYPVHAVSCLALYIIRMTTVSFHYSLLPKFDVWELSPTVCLWVFLCILFLFLCHFAKIRNCEFLVAFVSVLLVLQVLLQHFRFSVASLSVLTALIVLWNFCANFPLLWFFSWRFWIWHLLLHFQLLHSFPRVR